MNKNWSKNVKRKKKEVEAFTYLVMPANLPQQATLLSVDPLQQDLQVVAALHSYIFVEQSKKHQSRT
jgi:hypothetical protein